MANVSLTLVTCLLALSILVSELVALLIGLSLDTLQPPASLLALPPPALPPPASPALFTSSNVSLGVSFGVNSYLFEAFKLSLPPLCNRDSVLVM